MIEKITLTLNMYKYLLIVKIKKQLSSKQWAITVKFTWIRAKHLKINYGDKNAKLKFFDIFLINKMIVLTFTATYNLFFIYY
jgi:hypothetical protein